MEDRRAALGEAGRGEAGGQHADAVAAVDADVGVPARGEEATARPRGARRARQGRPRDDGATAARRPAEEETTSAVRSLTGRAPEGRCRGAEEGGRAAQIADGRRHKGFR